MRLRQKKPKFTQESNTLKDSGRSRKMSKMTSSCKRRTKCIQVLIHDKLQLGKQRKLRVDGRE